MRRWLLILDSRLLSRIGNSVTLWSVLSSGAALVLVLGLAGAEAIRLAGWIPVIAFGAWVVVACLVSVSWLSQRKASPIASPATRLAIEHGRPRSTGTLLNALREAESRGREFISEAALLCPVNNQARAAEFARSYGGFEADVASLVSVADQFDERWELAWAHKPSWVDDYLLEAPFTRARLDELVKYVAHRNKQLAWMIDYLQTGNDTKVRLIRHWVAAKERRRGTSEPGESRRIAPEIASIRLAAPTDFQDGSLTPRAAAPP
jgi:hypothetical protein